MYIHIYTPTHTLTNSLTPADIVVYKNTNSMSPGSILTESAATSEVANAPTTETAETGTRKEPNIFCQKPY